MFMLMCYAPMGFPSVQMVVVAFQSPTRALKSGLVDAPRGMTAPVKFARATKFGIMRIPEFQSGWPSKVRWQG